MEQFEEAFSPSNHAQDHDQSMNIPLYNQGRDGNNVNSVMGTILICDLYAMDLAPKHKYWKWNLFHQNKSHNREIHSLNMNEWQENDNLLTKFVEKEEEIQHLVMKRTTTYKLKFILGSSISKLDHFYVLW